MVVYDKKILKFSCLELLEELLEYVFEIIIVEYFNCVGLVFIELVLFESGIVYV